MTEPTDPLQILTKLYDASTQVIEDVDGFVDTFMNHFPALKEQMEQLFEQLDQSEEDVAILERRVKETETEVEELREAWRRAVDSALSQGLTDE